MSSLFSYAGALWGPRRAAVVTAHDHPAEREAAAAPRGLPLSRPKVHTKASNARLFLPVSSQRPLLPALVTDGAPSGQLTRPARPKAALRTLSALADRYTPIPSARSTDVSSSQQRLTYLATLPYAQVPEPLQCAMPASPAPLAGMRSRGPRQRTLRPTRPLSLAPQCSVAQTLQSANVAKMLRDLRIAVTTTQTSRNTKALETTLAQVRQQLAGSACVSANVKVTMAPLMAELQHLAAGSTTVTASSIMTKIDRIQAAQK